MRNRTLLSALISVIICSLAVSAFAAPPKGKPGRSLMSAKKTAVKKSSKMAAKKPAAKSSKMASKKKK